MTYFFNSEIYLNFLSHEYEMCVDVTCATCCRAPRRITEAGRFLRDVEEHMCEAGTYQLNFNIVLAVDSMIERYRNIDGTEQINFQEKYKENIRILKLNLTTAPQLVDTINFISEDL